MSLRLRDLVPLHDMMLIDQYGTLHDGMKPYPGAAEALFRLREAGCRVVILSNSGKRSAPNVARLLRLGFDPASFDLFLSSGEVAYDLLRWGRLFKRTPRTCLLISRDGDTSIVDGLGIAVVPRAEEAEAVLIAGSEAPRVGLDDYRALLAPAAARGVPALCVNPDMTMLTESGFAFAPGRIAQAYRELGGEVVFIGKPHPEIYRDVRERYPDAKSPVGIGDSLEHDVAGAKAAGIAAAFVRTGIAEKLDEGTLEAEFVRHARPDYVLDRFVW
jgi:HAD superfamily hydrolase (TIGR01459 family)